MSYCKAFNRWWNTNTFLIGLVERSILTIISEGRADDFIRKQLQKRHVSGLLIAIIHVGRIVKAKSYSFIEKNTIVIY